VQPPCVSDYEIEGPRVVPTSPRESQGLSANDRSEHAYARHKQPQHFFDRGPAQRLAELPTLPGGLSRFWFPRALATALLPKEMRPLRPSQAQFVDRTKADPFVEAYTQASNRVARTIKQTITDLMSHSQFHSSN